MRLLLGSLLTASILLAQTNDYRSQMEDFYHYKQQQYITFEQYKKELHQAFNQYKKELGAYWSDPKLSTKKEWVQYSKDKKTRSDVDFDKNKITIQTIAKTPQEAKKKLKKTLAKIVTIDTKNAFKSDPLEQRIAKIQKPKELVDAQMDAKPILAPIFFQKPPTKKTVQHFVNTHITPKKITKKRSTKIHGAFIYKVEVPLPKNATYKRSKFYENEVRTNAKRQKLPVDLIFAIMHTESCFNPKATSPIPAYGLMQIVPRTAGVDSYYYLYKVKKRPSRTYLYNAKNNVRLGSAYIHLLYYSYLRHIKDPLSRLYCAIAAYNTGAGNVAWAFTHRYNVKQAAKIINNLSPQEVYNRLLRDLRYDEPKHYLRNVTKRMHIYHKIYGS